MNLEKFCLFAGHFVGGEDRYASAKDENASHDHDGAQRVQQRHWVRPHIPEGVDDTQGHQQATGNREDPGELLHASVGRISSRLSLLRKPC